MKTPLRRHQNFSRAHHQFLFRRRYRSFFKKTLPLMGLALFVGILFFQEISFWKSEESPQTKALKQLDTMAHVGQVIETTYSAMNLKGQPYVIKADRAFSREDHVVQLDHPNGCLSPSAHETIQLASDAGVYHQTKKLLELSGHVRLRDHEGNTICTSHSTVDLATSLVSSSTPVSGYGPMGTMKADSFFYDQEKKWLCLKGRACVIIQEEQSNR